MHDIVAHSLQVIITQADGGRYAAAANPDAAVDALGTIADTGRGALAEMRRLLGVLRGPGDAEFRPQPGLMDLPDLLDTMRLTGLDVDAAVTGTPRRPLPAGAELAAYRVAQEALTNAARHGGRPRTRGAHVVPVRPGDRGARRRPRRRRLARHSRLRSGPAGPTGAR